jgi:hypothetical protein
MNGWICFGDSHAFCFDSVMETHYFPASSARGLRNIYSVSKANDRMRRIISNNKTASKYIFFFGKVDIDFIINHHFNRVDNFNISEFIDNTVGGYVDFIKSLPIKPTQVHICELPVGHVSDENLLDILNSEFNHNCVASFLSENYERLKTYTKVLSLEQRNIHLMYFNKQLKALCEENSFKFLEINKHWSCGPEGPIVIPLKYLTEDKSNHHLDNSIHKLFLSELT